MADETEGGRKLRTKERKKYVDQEIDEDDIDGRRMYSVEEKLNSTKFTADMVQELKGPDFTMEWMQKNGLTRPIVFYDKTGLGLRVPSENFKVSDVKQCVGSRRILDVMDVTTQKAMEMAMKDWVKYYENPERDRLLNVISLEFCHTRLENYVESPTLVRQIDWVDRAWPRHLKECQTESTNVIERMKYPKVQKYCLMSVAGCYTDFHIDFGGTSVWYHILHGEKIFWLAPPSPKNIDRYVEWTLSAKQGDTFLGDVLEQCQRINLHAGYTFIIPSGWIHAVYTPKDSLVFGGNFLHSFNIENQLLVSRIEDKTYVPAKFRYPFFSEIMWYVLDRYISCLTGRTYLASCEKDELEDDDQGLIQVDEDSRPPSRNPDSRPPSRAMDDSMDGKVKSESGEDTPKLSKSVTIELTRIDAALRRSQSEDENQPPQQSKARVPRKAVSDPNSAWEGGGGPRKWIHLTVTEMRGLRQMVDYLNGLMALPPNKRGIPKDVVDPEAVLKEIRQILEDHKNDDQELAVSGDPVIGWPESARKKQQKLKLGYKTFKTAKVKGQTSGSSSSIRRRRTRCKQCEACTRTECGECTFCKDMKKFGGPGRMKQTCISRQCMAPILPSSSVCMICNQEGQPNPDDPDDVSMLLMECGICWEIVHPSCLQKKYENLDNEGAVNEDLPNSWECSKCCNEGKQGQLKPRIRPGTSTKRIKTEDHRLSADSDGSQEEEPMSPISPVEGKRVVSKEGSGSRNSEPYIKTEHGSIKWPSPPKKLTSYADVKVKTEDDASASSSPSRDDSLRKRSQPTSAQKDPKKHVKKEKTSAPNSPSSLQQEEARNPRKRPAVTPGSSGGKGSPIPQMDGGKRPKREGPGCVAGDGTVGHQTRGMEDQAYIDQHQHSPMGAGGKKTNTSSVCDESVTDGEEMNSAPRASNSTVTSGSTPSGITTRSNGKHRGRGSSTAVSNSSSSKSSPRNPRSSTLKTQCNMTSVTAETKIPGTSQKRIYITTNNRYADAQRLLRASTAVSVHTKKTNFPGISKKKNFLSARDKAAAAAGLIRVVKTPQNIFDKFTKLCPSLKSVPSPSSSSSSSLKNATSISPCPRLKSISSPSTNNRNRFVNRPVTDNKNDGAVTNTMKSSHVNSSDPGTKLSPQTDVTSSVIISPSTFSSLSVSSSLSSSTSPSSLSSSLSSSAVSQPLAAPQKSSVIHISPPLFLKPRAGCPRVTVRKSPVSGKVTVRKSPDSSSIKGMKIIHVKTTFGPRTAANPHASISSPCPNTDPITTSSKHNTAVKTNTGNTDLTTNSADPSTDSTKYSTNTNSSTTTILSTDPTTSTSPNSVSTNNPTSASLSLGPSPSCPLSPPVSPTSPTSSSLHHALPNQSITDDHAYCKMKAENNCWEPASYVKTSF